MMLTLQKEFFPGFTSHELATLPRGKLGCAHAILCFGDQNYFRLGMLTDTPPRNANRAGFLESDRIKTVDLPQNGALSEIAQRLQSAMQAERIPDVRKACAEFLAAASDFYRVANCGMRVLAARPL